MPAELISKQTRQDMILEIVKSRDVHNQLELISLLEERGIIATQSSVSRDIHELSIAKVDGRYMVGVLPFREQELRLEPMNEVHSAQIYIRNLTTAGPNLLLVKTGTGGARSVALSIEESRWPEVLGTVSSYDTIFIAVAGKREQLRLVTRLQEFMRGRRDSRLSDETPEHSRAPEPVHEGPRNDMF